MSRRIWAGRNPVVLWLVIIGGLSIALRAALAAEVHGPFIFGDELVYQKLAQGLGRSGQLGLFNNKGVTYSPLYSVVLAPIYALGASAPAAYHWIKIVNATLMSLSVFPVYQIARFVLPRRPSLLAAAVSVLAPLMFYSDFVMSENLAYPLFLIAVWTILVALRTPSPGNDALLLVAIAGASAARIQLIALLPAALTAIVLVAAQDWKRSSVPLGRSTGKMFGQHWLLFSGAGALLVVAAIRAVAGHGAFSLAGTYSTVGSGGFPSPWRLIELAVRHLAGLDLAVGVLPFVGALVAAYAFVRYGSPRDTLIFAAVAVASTAWLLLEVAYFAVIISGDQQRQVPRIHERYLFYLVPLFLVALLAAVRLPETKASFRVCLGAAGLAALLPAVIPFGTIINNAIVADSFGLQIYGENIGDKIVPIAHPTLSAISFAATLALVYVLVRHRTRAVIVLVVGVFVLMSGLVRTRIIAAAEGSTKAGLPTHRDWVDRAVSKDDVVLVGGNGDQRIALLETAFNNLSITRVYYTCAQVFGGEFGEELVTVNRAGRLRAPSGYVSASYAVVPADFGVRGRVLARNPKGGLVLVALPNGQVSLPAGRSATATCM
jgi:hypothetical protein